MESVWSNECAWNPQETNSFWGKLFQLAMVCGHSISEDRWKKNYYLWWAVEHEVELLEAFVSKCRDHMAAIIFLKKIMKLYGHSHTIVTDRLRSYRAKMKIIGNVEV